MLGGGANVRVVMRFVLVVDDRGALGGPDKVEEGAVVGGVVSTMLLGIRGFEVGIGIWGGGGKQTSG